MNNTDTTTASDLTEAIAGIIAPVNAEQGDWYEQFEAYVSHDFRVEFPDLDVEFGNNSYPELFRAFLPDDLSARLTFDTEFSNMWIFGTRDDLTAALTAILTASVEGGKLVK